MDPTVITLITLVFTTLTGAISTLFILLIKGKDAQIVDKDKQIEKLDKKVDAQGDAISLNTSSLNKLSEGQAVLVTMLKEVLPKISEK